MDKHEAPSQVSGLAKGQIQTSEATMILASLDSLEDVVSTLTLKVGELLTRLDRTEEPIHDEPSKFLCPKCNAPMILRDGSRGQFYSCTAYFETGCRGSRNPDGSVGQKKPRGFRTTGRSGNFPTEGGI